MKIYSPLHSFITREKYFDFSNYLSLKVSYEIEYKIDDDGFFISKLESNDISICSHWIVIDFDKTELDEQIILNTLLIAFWTLSPNKVSYKYVFNDSEAGCNVIFSRFEFNKMDNNKSEYTIDDLQMIKKYFKMLESITIVNGRLHTALSNTFQGCVAFNWKTAFLLYSAAIEALLTYERGSGITKRLAKSCACLLETDNTKRKKEYDNFSKLYNIRSDIMHGNVNNNLPDANLLSLSKFSMVLRRLWQIFLSDINLIQILEKQDTDRKIYFKKLENSFNP